MIVVIALLALSAWAVPATVVAILRDGYRRQPAVTDHESFRSA